MNHMLKGDLIGKE